MPENKGLIVAARPNLLLPDNFLTAVEKDYTLRVGFAGMTEGAIEFGTFPLGEYALKESVHKVQQEFKSPVAFHFCKDGVTQEDEQPYICLAEEETALVAAFIDGDCKAFFKEGNTSAEYWMCKDFLTDAIHSAYIRAEGDMSAVYDLLDNAAHRKSFMDALEPKGSMLIMLANPDASKSLLVYKIGLKDTEYDEKNFWSSRHLGLRTIEAKKPSVLEKLKAEKSKVEAPPPEKKLSVLEKLKAQQAEKVTVDPSIGSKTLPPPKFDEDTKEKTSPTLNEQRIVTSEGIKPPQGVVVPDGHILVGMRNGGPIIVPKDVKLVAPPDTAYGKNLARWYNRNFGFCPDNFASERNSLPVYMLKGNSPLRDWVGKTFGVLSFLKPGQTEETLREELAKIEEEKAIQEKKVGANDLVPNMVPPRAAKEIRTKYKDVEPQSKEQIEASVASVEPAHKELGMPFELMVRLPTKVVRDIGNTSNQTLVCMYQEVCAYLLKKDPELQNWKREDEKPADTEVKEPKKESTLERLKRERAAKAA